MGDRLGNLESRADQTGNRNLAETFAYDGLNRLTRSTVGADVRRVTHDIHGRIRSKDGEAYTYHGPRPRLLSSAGGDWYRFDAAGNNTAGDGRNIAYTVFDKPSSITRGAHATRFRYGLDRARFERADTSAGGTTTTLYVGDTEIVTAPDGAWRMRRHIAGLAIETTAFDAEDRQLSQEAAYILRDHLGSVHLLTGQTGAVLQEMSFDAWGERRSPSTWGRLTGAGRTGFDASRTTRGFTGHEMLDAVGIIHMNGRIHDPRLGMFLQVDSMVQDAGSPSGLNPYAYALGNPLNAVDADGEYATLIVGIMAGLATTSAPKIALYVGSTAFIEALVRGADFDDALRGGMISGMSSLFSASIPFPSTPDAWELVKFGVLQGTVGGVTSMFQGGKFGHGFITSALPATFGHSLGGAVGEAFGSAATGQIITGALLGGTASSLTGGKFVNGAATAAVAASVNAAIKIGRAPTEAEVTHARMSEAVYGLSKAHVAAGFEIDGYRLTKYFDHKSGFKAALFVKGDQNVIAFRGTEGASWKDWKTNVLQAFGLETSQYSRAQKMGGKHGASFHFVGHSLGGGLAVTAAIEAGGSATVFNAAGVHNNTIGTASRSDARVVHFHATMDVLQIGNMLTPASVPGEQVSLGRAGMHGMGGLCEAVGC